LKKTKNWKKTLSASASRAGGRGPISQA
jgi:hypothetical protein